MESMEIPVVVGEIAKLLVPVPKVLVNAAELLATPLVVTIFDPPPIVNILLMTIIILIEVDTPTESVAVTLSLYVPVSMPAAIVTAPDVGLMEINEFAGDNEKVFVPVP